MSMMEKAKKLVAPAVCAMLVNGAVISTQANAGVIAGAGIIAAAAGSKSTGAKIIGAGAGTIVMGAGIGFGVYFLTLAPFPITPLTVLGSAFIVLDDKSVNEISKNLPFLHPSEMGDIKDLINSKLEGYTADDEIVVNVDADEVLAIMDQGDYTDSEIDSAVDFFNNL